ncbi:MAG: SufD family Fe-S cluster assembly protein [Sulfobacillus thermotolerans]|nr:SufD family Fe-S cluster assembly protein [Sulfobacillus thermotolerans]
MAQEIWKTFTDITPQSIVAHSQKRGEPSWLTEFRLSALATLNADLVTPYWPIQGFQKPNTNMAESGQTHADEAEVVYQQLTKRLAQDQIIYGNFYDVMRTHPQLLHKLLGHILPLQESASSALNAVLFTGGMVLYVPPGVTCPVPVSYFRPQGHPGQIERHLIWLDRGAHAQFIEGRPSLDFAPSHLVHTEVLLGAKATFQYIAVKNWAHTVSTWVTKRVVCEAESQLTWVEGHFGGAKTYESTQIILQGTQASTRVITCAVAESDQHIIYRPTIYHLGSHTASSLSVHGFSKDGPMSIQGGIFLAPTATHARLERDVLSTGPQATATEENVWLTLPDVITGPLWTTSTPSLSWTAAKPLTQPFVDQLPLEFSIEAERLLRQKLGSEP